MKAWRSAYGQGGMMLHAADLGARRQQLVQMAASPGRVLTDAIARTFTHREST
jgi:hypothetical protein